MKIIKMSTTDLIPYEKNPRVSTESVGQVMSSIKEFGFQQPIVVDSDHVIIIGHTRLQAAINLKIALVPVHVASDLSKAQVKALRLADNRVGEKSFWDTELLRGEIGDLAGLDFETDMKEFGFEGFELKSVFDGDGDSENVDNSFDDDDLPPTSKANTTLKIRFDDMKEKSEAYSILGVDAKKKAVDWNDVKKALDL